MGDTTPGAIAAVRAAIDALRPDVPDAASRFSDDHIRMLLSAHMTDLDILRSVSVQLLREAGLPIGLAAFLNPGGLARPYPFFG